jgi:DNA-binding winged helix-turn-helix (wHTH) protein
MILEFGEFVLDPDARLLRRGDQPIHLRAKTFDLLLLLLAARPKALAKAALIERLWPGTYVQEANLSNAIGELRRAFGERGTRSRFIRTVHTFGYAFAADLDEPRAPRATRPGADASVTTPASRLVWGTTVIMLADGESVLGRDDGSDVVLADTTVSRRHARITIGDDGATLADLGSQNGTWVNEGRVTEPVRLTNGDRIRLGRVLVTYRRIVGTLTTERLPTGGANEPDRDIL